MTVPYSLRLSLQRLFGEIWINLLSILTIAAGLFIVSLSFIPVYNLDVVAKKLPDKFSMIVYLDNSLNRNDINQVVNSLKKNKEVNSIRYISKDEALKELKSTLRDSTFIFEGLDENPLPDSLEIKLRRDAVDPNAVREFSEKAARIDGITEINYGEKFLSTIYYLKVGLQTLGTIFIIIMSAGIIFVCYSTVKILFYRRKEEIETFKLLGASKGFIRTPFLIEGAFIGGSGGTLSLIGIYLFSYIVFFRLADKVPIFKSVAIPENLFLSLPLVGILLGITGAVIALGRLKY